MQYKEATDTYRQRTGDTIDKATPQNAPENYERFFVPAIGAPVAVDLMRAAALHPGEQVLDVACGTGVVARMAAEAVGHEGTVTGIDINPGMIEVAKGIGSAGATVEWRQGDAQDMPLPETAYDVVLCQMGLQFMPDKKAALLEMHRVLRPGGRIIVNLPGPIAPVFQAMDEALEQHVGNEAAGFVKTVFSLHEPKKVRKLFKDAGFTKVDVKSHERTLRLPAPTEFLWQYVYSTPLAATVAQIDEDDREALERDVVAKWQPFVEDGGMVCPQAMVQVTGKK